MLVLISLMVTIGGVGVSAQPGTDTVAVSADHRVFLPLTVREPQPSAPPTSAMSDISATLNLMSSCSIFLAKMDSVR
ncbi:MAG TPA: hypothetical protein PKC19_21725 [Roseiflexaceae bacterium]|nr:hypothetical protein [Roseiflexaceae bacterium]